MNFRDVELLSAYLDGRLNPSDAAHLEARLASDANLKATLEDLRHTRGVLRRLPQRRAPRNFRLTPKMAGIKPPEPRAYPAFRFATALAAFLFLASVAVNAITPIAAPRLAAAPAAPLGMGGGGGYGGGPSESQPVGGGSGQLTEAPAATQAAAAPFAAVMPTPTAEGTMGITAATAAPQSQDTTRAGAAAATEQANKTGPVEPPAAPHAVPSELLVPWTWVTALGVLMLVCGLVAWSMRSRSERRIRDRWNKT